MAKNNKNSPAEVVKDLRKAIGLTQEQFAAKIGVTVSTVNRWEKGRSRPQPLAMKQIDALRNEIK